MGGIFQIEAGHRFIVEAVRIHPRERGFPTLARAEYRHDRVNFELEIDFCQKLGTFHRIIIA